MHPSQLVLLLLTIIILHFYCALAAEVPEECQGQVAGNYCSNDLRGYYQCLPVSREVPTYRFRECPPNWICTCFKHLRCGSEICKPKHTPLPLVPSFVTMYHGAQKHSVGDVTLSVQGTIHQDTVGQRIYKDEHHFGKIDETQSTSGRTITLVVPYMEKFKKYVRRNPGREICDESVIDGFESFMPINNSLFIRTSKQQTLHPDVSLETWKYMDARVTKYYKRSGTKISCSITWVLESNSRTLTSKPISFEEHFDGAGVSINTKWTSIVTVAEHPSDAWYSYLPNTNDMPKKPIFCK